MQEQAAGTPTQPPTAHLPYLSHYLYPNHHHSSSYPNPNPGGVDPYAASVAATSSQTYDAAYYAQSTVYSQASPADATSAAAYYQDPNAQNWTIPYTAAGVATSGAEQLVAAQANSISWKTAARIKKILKKQRNPVQHVWCDVCKIECTSKEMLDSHKQGKKHQKNLEKLKATLTPTPVAPIGVSNKPIIGPPENPKKRKEIEPEDLESKKKKIVAGGAAVDAVRTCEICNVVCNSELVFKYHLAGQKHVAMMKKCRVGP